MGFGDILENLPPDAGSLTAVHRIGRCVITQPRIKISDNITFPVGGEYSCCSYLVMPADFILGVLSPDHEYPSERKLRRDFDLANQDA